MSPLGLLQEGEIAEIIDTAGNGFITHQYKHRHCRRGGFSREGTCADYSHSHYESGRFNKQRHTHLQDMGLHPGKKVEMISNSGTGPLILRVDECRIAIGRGAAMKIYVRRNGE
ncbi:MAG TPA: FeoA family protein [Smithella sp.]|nr:FeoA family protein [Smithella sp.]